MSLRRQKARVAAISSHATEQARHLKRVRAGMRRWKRQTFARPESLALAFIAGMAISSPAGEPDQQSSGKGLAIKALEASFLAWRLLGNRVTARPEPADSGVDEVYDA